MLHAYYSNNCFVNIRTCIGAKPCLFPGDMRCNSSQVCIRSDQWCNNQIDCDDESDESDCCKHYIILCIRYACTYVCILAYNNTIITPKSIIVT